ncbi:MAG TPA: SDR family NAD(P)-dependent oxidoreductase [Lacipirellulaceae bacterium]|nr:SDR family NAD(P)-dependent oxidoreductase [Lacipirellulaceae bacterium]
MTYRQLTDRRALITGASSGIGRALAIELARRGVDSVLLARREDRLGEVAQQVNSIGRRAVAVAGDVTNPAARRRAVDAARNGLGGLDILVNNAGIAAHGRFAEADPGRLRPIMEVNFFAPVELIREALPLLREARQPIVVNIGSILGERGCPHKSEYSASKFALHGFSEAVRPELLSLGIDLLVAAAGPTETEHFDTLIEDKGELPWGNPRRKPAEEVARLIVRAIERGKNEVVTSWRGWFWLLLNRLTPRIVDRIMSRYG